MTGDTHPHITTWIVAIILFVVALILHKKGQEKAAKIVQMILRLFYIAILVTGFILYMNYAEWDHMLYGLKFLFGLLVIVFMELVLVRTVKEKSTTIFWVLLIITFLITFFLGGKLPLNWNWFA